MACEIWMLVRVVVVGRPLSWSRPRYSAPDEVGPPVVAVGGGPTHIGAGRAEGPGKERGRRSHSLEAERRIPTQGRSDQRRRWLSLPLREAGVQLAVMGAGGRPVGSAAHLGAECNGAKCPGARWRAEHGIDTNCDTNQFRE